MPKLITDAIVQLPAAQQFGARLEIGSATEFDRQTPLTILLDKSSSDLDALWTAASAL